MHPVDLSDTEILNRIINGEKEWFRVIMDRYASLVFHVVRRYETEHDQMTERAHEIFLKAYERLDSFQGKAAFSSWLYRLAHNHCLDESRRRKSRNMLFSELPEDYLTGMKDGNPEPDAGMEVRMGTGTESGTESGIESGMETEEMMDADGPTAKLRKALKKLDDTYAVPLLMKYRDGMSYEDISEDLNVPVGALKVRVHRARKELKSHMEKML